MAMESPGTPYFVSESFGRGRHRRAFTFADFVGRENACPSRLRRGVTRHASDGPEERLLQHAATRYGMHRRSYRARWDGGQAPTTASSTGVAAGIAIQLGQALWPGAVP